MTRKRLRPEDMDLWTQVARTTRPLPETLKRYREPTVDPAVPAETKPSKRDPIAPFDIGHRALATTETHVFPKTTADRLHQAPVQMDAKAYQKLKRGKLAPEARIDLHGKTLDQAHPALTRFILSSQSRGCRLVLVITGKGSREDPYDPMPRRRGVLKTQVPQWLRLPPLSGAVMQISEAHIKHGGAGAYYVYLRRLRGGA